MRKLKGALVYMKKLTMKPSLSFKIIGVVLVISLCFFPPLAYVNIENSREILELAYIEKAKTIARLLDANIRDKAALRDESRLFAHIQKNIWLDPDIISIDIHLPDQGSLMTFVSSENERTGRPADADNVNSYTKDMLINKIVEKDHQRYLRVITPIHIAKQQAGTYQIELTLEHVDRQIRTAIQVSVLSYLAMILVFVLLLFWFLRVIMIRPVKEMNRGVKTIARGDLDWRVKIASQDEIGELATAFNQMTDDLKASHRSLQERRMALEQEVDRRMAAEKKLQKAHDQLERRVEERTVELVKTNEQLKWEIGERKQMEEALREAKQTAEAANRAKSEFLANMSHELRTPLNHIIGFTELVVGQHFGDLNETQAEYLTDVLHSSHHLLSLINDILDLSKVEAGKLELEPSEVNLRMLLENSLIIIKEKAMKHGIQLSMDIEDIPETITADERKLKQILYNLLSNAVKFTPEGGEIHVDARMVDRIARPGLRWEDSKNLQIIESQIHGNEVPGTKRKTCAEFSVSDTGIGIRPEDQARIFSPFEQVEGASSRRFQGTGLGLSLTKSLVELHGGMIWAESEGEGKGSTFTFIIPI